MIHPVSLADPTGSDALVAAVTWLEATLLGTVATTIAVIGVASIGFRMLTGHIELRRGMTIICGCFIVLGAGGIAAGIASIADGLSEGQALAMAPPADPPPAIPVEAPRQYDPYAGASVFR